MSCPTNRIANYRVFTLAVGTALAGATLAGCATSAAPAAEMSASRAEKAMAKGEWGKAVDHAEAAVAAEPDNAAHRATLGAAYLESGRFQSAAQSFSDAMTLGDTSGRTALSLALSQIALGQNAQANSVLDRNAGSIPAADLGLAQALAGRADAGVTLLANTLRSGENTPKVRQNLAYAYALAGRWQEARLMASQDLQPDQLDARISEWAQKGRPEMHKERVAGLINAPVAADPGLPARLALGTSNAAQVLVAEAAQPVATPVALADYSAGELPAVNADAPVEAAPVRTAARAPLPPVPAQVPQTRRSAFEKAFPGGEAAPSMVSTPAPQVGEVKYVSQRVGTLPAVRDETPAAIPAPAPDRASPVAALAGGSHLVQLGSFSSEAGAKRAWGIYAKRWPELKDHQMVITEAVVRGKRYYRVSAAGFARNEAASMCGKVKARGQGCFAWTEGRPMPGAVDLGRRMARR